MTPLLSRSLASTHIPKLDGLRAISALLVMLYHFGWPIPAGFGVECFFVISGFLITWLLLAEHEQTGAVSLRAFYTRRAFRILPAFYAFWFLVTTALVLRHGHIIWGQAISSFAYVANYYQGLNGYPSTAFSRTWSLAVEEQFYLLWPLLFRRFASRPGLLLKTLGGITLGIWIYRIVLWKAGVPEAYLYTAFDCRADAILAGCSMAIALKKGYLRRALEFACSRKASLPLCLALLLSSLVLHNRFGTDYRDTVAHIAEPIIVAFVIVLLLASDSRAVSWLDSRPLRFLGVISYSTYLYHGLAPVPESLPVVVKVIPAYMLASVSYFAVERPFLKLRDRFLQRMRKPHPSVVFAGRRSAFSPETNA